jgi:hypothetical protein
MSTALAFIIILLMLVAAFYLLRFFTRRAVRQVVAVFRQQGATNSRRAKTLQELGLVQAPMLQRMFKPRDYRPQALQVLAREGVLRVVEGERVYLSEEALIHSRLKEIAKID